MKYQTPQLELVGSAHHLVLGLQSEPAGDYSDNKDIVDQGIVLGNSRATLRP